MNEKHRSFADMSKSLRASAAAGMATKITLDPDAALTLARILEAHERQLEIELFFEINS